MFSSFPLVPLGLFALVFILFAAAAADAGSKLNLGSDQPKKRKAPGDCVFFDEGVEGPGWYLDDGTDYPVHKIDDM